MVFLAIIGVFLIPMGVLSEFSTDPDPDEEIDGLVCGPLIDILSKPVTTLEVIAHFEFLEASVKPKKDADGNPTKACSDYGEDDCADATVEYDITEASGCEYTPPFPAPYGEYWYCVTEKKIVPNGSCIWVNGNCTDDTSYEGETLYYTSKCSFDHFEWPKGMENN